MVEAMADGLPVIGGRSGGVSETNIDGQTGLLFNPGDISAHADAMRTLASDPSLRQQMGTAAWRRASEHFAVEYTTASLLKVLHLREWLACRPSGHVDWLRRAS